MNKTKTDNVMPSRPVPPPLPNVETVPRALLELNIWLGWRYKWNGQKWSKPPCSAVTGGGDGWQDSLVMFDDAIAGAKANGLDGVGFYFRTGDKLVGGDFDGCIDDGKLDPGVEVWLRWLPGYWETSPSGTGLHFVVTGKLPKALAILPLKGSDSTIELYCEKRYFTFTGKPWGEPRLNIENGQTGIDKLLAHIGIKPDADEATDETTVEQAVRYLNRKCDELSQMTDGRQVRATQVCWRLGRIIGANTGDPRLEFSVIKDRITAALKKTCWPEAKFEVIQRQLEAGMVHPINFVDEQDTGKEAHAEALNWSEWVFNQDAVVPDRNVSYDNVALLTAEEFEPFIKMAAKRLGIRASSLEGSVKQRRATSKARAQTAVSNNLTAEQVKKSLSDLLLTTDKERAALGLPESIEKASQVAEIVLWDYIKENAAIFCTESGLGYILLNDAKDAPIPVTHDGHELSAFLSGLGIHPGAKARNRIGKHFGNQCWREGTRIEPRISFHYDPPTFSAYFAETPGQLIKVTANEITRVPNGTDGQLFLLPRNYEPWRVDLDNLPPGTDIGPDAYALLPEILFDVLEFENESLCRDDVCVLVGAYIITLFLPGIVAGKLLLEIQGGTGSGKTLFARMLGRLIYGRSFEVTGMDSDESQFENALVNNSFLVLDDVKRASNPAILGMIRRAVTGGKSVRRELYSTFGQVSEPYRASIAITSSEEPFSGSDEMSNRELIIFAKQREGYLDEKEMLERIDTNRNALMSEMMVRLQNIIIAVKAQAHFKPVVKMRMASFATFLLRVGRQWDWGVSAEEILDAWKEEQEGSGLDASIVETLELWLAEPELDEGKHYTAGELHRQMVLASQRHNLPVPWWFAKAPALIRALRNGFHAYRRHFGFSFEGRTSGHKPASYWFDPKLRDAEAKKGSGRDAEAEKGVPVRDAEAKKGLPVEQHKIPF